MTVIGLSALSILILLWAGTSAADPPLQEPETTDAEIQALLDDGFWYQGRLTDGDGSPLANTNVSVTFRVYDVSSGGTTAETRNPTTPGYNVPIAERVRREAGIATRTVGLITTPAEAEAVVAEGRADMVALGRAFLDHPHWGWSAARELGAEVERPLQYLRVGPRLWTAPAPRQ